jgi:cell division protein FtsL
MDELFSVVGRLYVDMYNTQKYIESLQKQIKDKDNEISLLKTKIVSASKDSQIVNEQRN